MDAAEQRRAQLLYCELRRAHQTNPGGSPPGKIGAIREFQFHECTDLRSRVKRWPIDYGGGQSNREPRPEGHRAAMRLEGWPRVRTVHPSFETRVRTRSSG